MRDWTVAARDALAHGPAALVTVLATEGSAPRGPGTRMLVTAEGLAGTIGGGALEHQAAAQARAILDQAPGSWRVQDWPLGPLLGQCCGGRVRLLVERLAEAPEGHGPWDVTLGEPLVRVAAERRASLTRLPARGALPEAGSRFVEPGEEPMLRVLMFGAGHVGRAIAARAEGLPLHLGWFDARPEAAETPGMSLASEAEMVACAERAAAGSAVVILTHDHALDYRLAAAALRGEAGFVGLIGSATKRARFLSRLAKEGIDAARLTCPIGLAGIAGKAPDVIAIAVLAQLLMLEAEG
ncbi:xanthine dehydrogenase accessory protein XdhC [Sphingomonas sp.]|uniref:xanthine dehydrogenase accessory protein XdhC n=1 Tax=Sphingomonas sp. TaxID=28214 RepID=UPI001B0F6667|nr:xanthine dehydrogenase accessory protein XdhC [Sphingomonas sp.]MBO9713231.1 xanthine dehydrogenase accessory protein XdhC [Sphingomonas sp.]